MTDFYVTLMMMGFAADQYEFVYENTEKLLAELEAKDKIIAESLQNKSARVKELVELCKAKDEAYVKLQQAYDNLTAQYQKDVNELEVKLEPKTCDGCEYEGDKVGGFCYAFHTTCSREPTSDHFTPRKGK